MFGISGLPNVNIHGMVGRFWLSSIANFTRFLHEHGLTVSNAIPLFHAPKIAPRQLRRRISRQGLLTFGDSQIGIEVGQGYQMGGSLDPDDIDRHTVGAHRPVLPGAGL